MKAVGAAAPVHLAIPSVVASATRQRTSATEDAAVLAPLAASAAGYTDTLPPRSLTTLQFAVK